MALPTKLLVLTTKIAMVVKIAKMTKVANN